MSKSNSDELREKVKEIVDEFRKTSYIARENLGQDDAVSLQALANITTVDSIMRLIEAEYSKREQSLLDELEAVDGMTSDEYEDNIESFIRSKRTGDKT